MGGTAGFPWRMAGVVATHTAAVAILGLRAALRHGPEWRAGLATPSLTPPPGAYPFIWLFLFATMAAAAILVRVRAGSFEASSAALGLYFTQLSMMLAWSLVFFEFRDWTAALAVAIGACILIVLTIRAFSRWSRPAAWLMAPALAVSAFVGFLNAEIASLN